MRKQYSPVLSFCLMVLVVAAMVCAMYTSSAEAGNLCMHVRLVFFFPSFEKRYRMCSFNKLLLYVFREIV
jgi:hypothetical protein